MEVYTSKDGSLEYYRIIATNDREGYAYAEKISSYMPMANNRAYVQTLKGDCYFAELSSIVSNPEIVRKCSAAWLLRLRFDRSVIMLRVFKQMNVRNRAYVIDSKGNKVFYGTVYQCGKFIDYMLKDDTERSVSDGTGTAGSAAGRKNRDSLD